MAGTRYGDKSCDEDGCWRKRRHKIELAEPMCSSGRHKTHWFVCEYHMKERMLGEFRKGLDAILEKGGVK